MHVYEVRPRKDDRGVDLTSDALPFGRLCYGQPDAVANLLLEIARFYCALTSMWKTPSHLIPLSNKRNFLEVPGDILERVDPIFYSGPTDCCNEGVGYFLVSKGPALFAIHYAAEWDLAALNGISLGNTWLRIPKVSKKCPSK